MSPLSTLAGKWRICHGAAIMNRWKFARHLLEFVEQHPDITHAEIGVACGEIINEKPYSSMWVWRHVRAAKAFSSEPRNDAERSRFNQLVHGATKTRDTIQVSMNRPERLINVGISMLKKAIVNGADPEAIITAVAKELRGKARAAA
jgi:hypothetical protein